MSDLAPPATPDVDHWWAYGNYNGEDCANCGRERVMIVEHPTRKEIRMCEKCCWSPDLGDYVHEAVGQ